MSRESLAPEPETDVGLSRVPTLRHGFFPRDVSLEAIARSLADEGDDPFPIASMRQVHGRNVAVVAPADADSEPPEADALATSSPRLALAVRTADCVPTLIAAPEAGVVAVAHAGWRGALNGILDETIHVMRKLGAKLDDLVAAVGPAISQENYEVDDQFRRAFAEKFGEQEIASYFVRSVGREKHRFNLPAFTRRRLRVLGVRSSRVTVSATCTRSDTRFASHRRGKENGRQFSAIVRVS